MFVAAQVTVIALGTGVGEAGEPRDAPLRRNVRAHRGSA
jgi:hypothetical protein